MTPWIPLTSGQDLLVQTGLFYAVVALVKHTHDEADIEKRAIGYGLQPFAFQDNVDAASVSLPPAPSGYRYVAGQAQATRGGATVPWSVPSPWSLFDSSTLVRAWAAEPSTEQGQPLPTVSCPRAPSRWPALLAGSLLGFAAYWAVSR